ncbi:hypothetical protein VaNZ11_011748 [Volvox africanus]|uniref:Glutathione S-transferase n=1 Tax=Volvox africanus TaxID=51714 RepID=A0ABQ5SDL6_9CHLO|nr:hypothetical protein VaNZ11_011748 [Volvox africanus]
MEHYAIQSAHSVMPTRWTSFRRHVLPSQRCAPALSQHKKALQADYQKIVAQAALLETPLKLHYFGFPGRAEASRLCLAVGNVPYEEVIYTQGTWPEHKGQMPFGQVPVLEMEDGKMLAESLAIERYVAKLAGLYPEDPLQAALADQAAFLSDIWEVFAHTIYMPLSQKISVRRELLVTKIAPKLQNLSKLLETSGEYVAGGKLSYGDVVVFVNLCSLSSGILPGVPTDLLKDYPVLKAYRNRIACIPAIKEFYEKRGEGFRAAFKPDAA